MLLYGGGLERNETIENIELLKSFLFGLVAAFVRL
jgi:hypothetical protein